ncbi:TolC family protein [Hymenobacter oligotrophus]|uniref:TolC family protein n=1 Tax=Hymenobacter oligotrophus TaxID=2319843 RepID=A0A3B7R4A8_9BACT|nr:TolC family protein [Hymenobacter oligotrophus]AYA38233.1 TolC family protein [Hymenobacter oligotrophus]
MKKAFRLLLLVAAPGFLGMPTLSAQTPSTGQPVATSTPMALSLQQAINYALQNKSTLQATRINEKVAQARVGEIRSAGLPQINGAVAVTDNFKLQKALVSFPNQQTVLTQTEVNQAQNGQEAVLTSRQGPAIPPQPFAFGLQWQGNAGVQASQLLFNGSYLLGLKAAKVYEALSVKQTQQSEIEVMEQVSKAYYSTLVARERLQLLARNVQRLDTLLYQTKQTYKEGFVEKLDVDRLQVQVNNLKIEQQNAQRLVELSVALLKFQMGLDQRQPVELTDKLDGAVVDAEAERQRLQSGLSTDFNYSNRVEYSVLETQRDLAVLDVRNRRAGYLPSLNLVGSYGVNGSDRTLGGLMEFRGTNSTNEQGFRNQNWFGFGSIGLQLQIPVFDGFRKKYSIEQGKLALEQVNKGFTTLQQSIDLQRAQTQTTLQNSLDVLANQKANLELATNVARVAKIKFQEGVGSNLEVITAETDLRQAQTNYYAALYDVLVAKVDFNKASGSLSTPSK